jgi:hypothetical protein
VCNIKTSGSDKQEGKNTKFLKAEIIESAVYVLVVFIGFSQIRRESAMRLVAASSHRPTT